MSGLRIKWNFELHCFRRTLSAWLPYKEVTRAAQRPCHHCTTAWEGHRLSRVRVSHFTMGQAMGNTAVAVKYCCLMQEATQRTMLYYSLPPASTSA